MWTNFFASENTLYPVFDRFHVQQNAMYLVM